VDREQIKATGSLDPTMADPQQVRAAMLANERAWPRSSLVRDRSALEELAELRRRAG
jgi:hypothetical protein